MAAGAVLRVDARWVRASYLLFVAAWAVGDATGNLRDNWKYLFLLACAGLCLLVAAGAGWGGFRPGGLANILLPAAFMGVVSVLAMFGNGYRFYALADLFFLTVPALFACLLMNADGGQNRDFYFDAWLYTQTLVVLVTNLGHLNLPSVMSISFSASYSPFESARAHEFAILLTYYYIRKKRGRLALAAVMSLLTFKRVHILYVAAVLLLGWAVRRRRVGNGLLAAAKLFFILTPLTLAALASPAFSQWFATAFDVSFQAFSMSRLQQMQYVRGWGGPLWGLGAVEAMLVRTGYPLPIFHLDLLRLSLETTPLGLAAFVCGWFNMVKRHRNIYVFLLVALVFFVMQVSTTLNSLPGFLLLYLMCETDFAALAVAEKPLPAPA